MKHTGKILVGLFFVAMLVFSCQKFEEYPVIPRIEYSSFGVVKSNAGQDSLGYLTINYTDGDGDIGLREGDTIPPNDVNYFLNLYQYINDTLRKFIFPDSNVNFNARIPDLTPDGVNKAIKGSIEYEFELYQMIPFLESDTIAFEIYIKDRALHQSNVIMTPLFIVH